MLKIPSTCFIDAAFLDYIYIKQCEICKADKVSHNFLSEKIEIDIIIYHLYPYYWSF